MTSDNDANVLQTGGDRSDSLEDPTTSPITVWGTGGGDGGGGSDLYEDWHHPDWSRCVVEQSPFLLIYALVNVSILISNC